MGKGLKLSHYVIASLYRTLSWYYSNRGAPLSPHVLKLFDLWKNLHASFFNISDEGWQAIEELIREVEENLELGSTPGGKDARRWLFLYALETYLNIVVRSITLSKLGIAARDASSFTKNIESMRKVFEPNVFEWFIEALDDSGLPKELREGLNNAINTVLDVMYNLNLLYVTTDMFREVYQDILPPEVRKSLGEFYTSDEIVNRVLDAAGLSTDTLRGLYDRWRSGARDTLILDPACGSGSFLVNIVKRIFNSLEGRPLGDVVKFIESNVVGIDVNPFAVEMAKLNLIIAIANEMIKRGGVYIPSELRVYWADSLSRPKREQSIYEYNILTIKVPALQKIVGEDSISIPFCTGVEPVVILDEAVKRITSGKSFTDFLQRAIEELEKGCESLQKNVIAPTLEKMYDTLKAIYDSGNSRVISLLRNIIAVQALAGKCSYVVGNPPWVRIHNLDKNVLNYLRENYEWVKKGSKGGQSEESIAFSPKFKKTNIPFAEQIDYSVVFVERGLEFLKEGGVLSYVITSKVAKATYAGKMREDLVRKYTLLKLIDYSLYPVQLFRDVVNYPLILSVKKAPPQKGHRVSVTVYNTGGESKSFEIVQEDLPLYSGTSYPNKDRSPWVLGPPEVISMLKKIVSNSPRLGDLYEVMRGVMTSLNEGYIGSIDGCDPDRKLVRLRLENDAIVEVEEHLVNPVIRGEDIDAFNFKWDEYIIFPHNISTLEPLWDEDQRKVLSLLGLLSQNVKVRASGGLLEYEAEYKVNSSDTNACAKVIDNLLQKLVNNNYRVNLVTPCGVNKCLEILNNTGSSVLKINISIETSKDKCIATYTISGLRLPNAPKATQHFIGLLEKLVKRDDYRANLPPWVIFRVLTDKFKEYRIAWREMGIHTVATHLPVITKVNLCGVERRGVIVPIQTVYFIVENDILKAFKLLIYINSDIARSLVKLWAWSARGGYYRHTSYNMGLLPIPRALVEGNLWRHIDKLVRDHINADNVDLNRLAKSTSFTEEMEKELAEALGITWEEYKAIVEYGKWLNEAIPLQYSVEELKEIEEEE
ncbi:MAG: N-6 DNA methylase [Acidilobus sp.]